MLWQTIKPPFRSATGFGMLHKHVQLENSLNQAEVISYSATWCNFHLIFSNSFACDVSLHDPHAGYSWKLQSHPIVQNVQVYWHLVLGTSFKHVECNETLDSLIWGHHLTLALCTTLTLTLSATTADEPLTCWKKCKKRNFETNDKVQQTEMMWSNFCQGGSRSCIDCRPFSSWTQSIRTLELTRPTGYRLYRINPSLLWHSRSELNWPRGGSVLQSWNRGIERSSDWCARNTSTVRIWPVLQKNLKRF